MKKIIVNEEMIIFRETFFLAGCSIKQYVNIDKINVTNINKNFSKLLLKKISKWFANENIGYCQRYKE